MTNMIVLADRWHTAVTSRRGLRVFTRVVRVLLALGFLPSGCKKVIGQPFTRLDPVADPIGHFFDALERAGMLYEFIGVCQVAAAILLLIPRTAPLGAVVYLPQITGIVVITTTMDFHFTWVITGLMLLGNAYLLCWDWPRLRPLLVGVPHPAGPVERGVSGHG
jgi:uncharacterized membrane protein YphA (DoxX/SURF4 family)